MIVAHHANTLPCAHPIHSLTTTRITHTYTHTPPPHNTHQTTKMQLFYTILSLGVLAASALKNCELGDCTPGMCYTSMKTRGLQCPGTSKPRHGCDYHDPFQGTPPANVLNADLRLQCCHGSCYAAFVSNKALKCPTGYSKPDKYGTHDPFGVPDFSHKTAAAIQSTCCKKINLCYTKLTEKNLDCDGFGRMPSKHGVCARGGWGLVAALLGWRLHRLLLQEMR